MPGGRYSAAGKKEIRSSSSVLQARCSGTDNDDDDPKTWPSAGDDESTAVVEWCTLQTEC
ncbi:putative bromodomain and WD repeat-containing protein 2 [Anopheles sinensis]|uniref:Putative bromodomain and WD repeat-containing protein 2 n=1 Tax=Anopheles sinensis TaxID=74873 RepID=A0A084WJW4_ANOSI|nr:putative bromodomain and WD repeat-containing protein 2 [Anopheles sinensis]